MAFRVAHFIWPKHSEAPETCADAYAYSIGCVGRKASLQFGQFAVADGVSEAILSGEWARVLCETFAKAGPAMLDPQSFAEWTTTLCERFDKKMREWAEDKYQTDSRFWSLVNKVNMEGSQATFLGLRMEEPDADGQGSWKAISVGDCCLTWWNDEGMSEAWPADDPADYGTAPGVLGTKGIARGAMEVSEGSWCKDQTAVLTSDAMSIWLLKHASEFNAREWADWKDSEFGAWLDREREAKRIRDDDCVMLIIRWEDERHDDDEETQLPRSESGRGDLPNGEAADESSAERECSMDVGTEAGGEQEPPASTSDEPTDVAQGAEIRGDNAPDTTIEHPPRRGWLGSWRMLLHACFRWISGLLHRTAR